ncbi:single-stranded-DNA-specific exonuclease RecJ [Poseidonocella sp. HB161398]|uniref:single-stranded-DNA-specific exonuclease RecJ n=1 Tax=Poseidonocella sp. HB161398 TaxID=2320855 RepID=UPI001109ED2F|nr:single-stranded-DNA-specific exonuclease RecJ [Poseidonocella sp. HB161398]
MTGTAFLGVTASATGRRWIGPDAERMRAAEALVQMTGRPEAVCQILARRGVPAAEAEGFLSPRLRDLLPDPRVLKDMEKAAARLVEAAVKGERVAVFADYDVDGGTSAALMIRWLRHFGIAATLYVPDRIDEGYGPNAPAMAELSAGHDVIFCVDCGTLSHEALEAATVDVVVLDHHLGGETLPRALAVVNPNRLDESGDLAHLCAAGVVFLTLVEANRQLREQDRTGPNLMEFLDLVALGTVADVAPLIGVNRAFVMQGLTVMARRGTPGIVALSDSARLDGAPTSYHLGFVLGPRVNAGGRVGRADLGARLLATDDPQEAAGLAARLEDLNRERREIEAKVRAQAMAQAEERGFDAPLVWAAGQGWHPGVVGIVASRMKEATNRPSIVIGLEDGIGKGSGRSVSGIDLGSAVQRAAIDGLLVKGGGHKMAAGLTVEEGKLEEAMAAISEALERQGAAELGPRDMTLDGVLMPAGATVDLVGAIEAAGPFGAGAPAPRFAFPSMRIQSARQVGEGHLRVTATDGSNRIEGIAFGAFDTDLGRFVCERQGMTAHLAGRLDLNTWNGRTTVQLRLEDAAAG